MQEIKFEVNMKTKNMFAFLVNHTYSTFSGIFGVLLSLGALVMLITTYQDGDDTKIVVLVIVSLLFTIVNPILLFIKAKKQVLLNPMYKNPIEYVFCTEGIKVTQGDQEGVLHWADMQQIKETKTILIIYTTKIHAFIFPLDAIGNQLDKVHELMAEQLKESSARIPNKIKRK